MKYPRLKSEHKHVLSRAERGHMSKAMLSGTIDGKA